MNSLKQIYIKTDRPKVSFLIPVYNAERFLSACLDSIRRQDYPPDQFEIIVADGGSTDRTCDIAREHGARVIPNPDRLGEAGKLRALKESTGEMVVFMDADNEIMGTDWLRRSVELLESKPDLLGMEAHYTAHPVDTSLNHYLTTLLHINDPIAWKMAAGTRVVEEMNGYRILEIQPPHNFPTGANGFMFLRATLMKVYREGDFHESEWSRQLIQSGHRKIGMLKDAGVAHHYVGGLTDLWRKRRHAGALYLKRKSDYGSSWFLARGKGRLLLVCLWFGLVVPSLLEALVYMVRDRSPAWLWHPVIGWVVLLNHALTFVTEKLGSHHSREERIRKMAAEAQVRK